jgi:hypothetical protein
MIRTSLALVLLAAPTLGLAGVSTLECKGTSPAGTKQTITVSFDEAAGWVDDNGKIKYRDGVTPNFLTGIKVFIDRRNGEYETRKTTAGEKFKGTCTPTESKVVAANVAK